MVQKGAALNYTTESKDHQRKMTKIAAGGCDTVTASVAITASQGQAQTTESTQQVSSLHRVSHAVQATRNSTAGSPKGMFTSSFLMRPFKFHYECFVIDFGSNDV